MSQPARKPLSPEAMLKMIDAVEAIILESSARPNPDAIKIMAAVAAHKVCQQIELWLIQNPDIS